MDGDDDALVEFQSSSWHFDAREHHGQRVLVAHPVVPKHTVRAFESDVRKYLGRRIGHLAEDEWK